MKNLKSDLPQILNHISLRDLKRIDVALEGNWNPTVATVWSKDKGFLGFSGVVKSHPKYKPSVELYFDHIWIGIHCYRELDKQYVFDENLALRIIEFASFPRKPFA